MSGLVPSERDLYDPTRFLGKIQSKMGIITQMQCNINKENVYQLLEIRFCVNKKWRLTNCPSRDQPTYSKNKQGVKKKGPNSQKKSPPPPPPRLPSFHIGMCYGEGKILFPALVPASPPPPRRTIPPPPPRKSPPLKRKQWPPPPPPPPPTLKKSPLTPTPRKSPALKQKQWPPPSPPPIHKKAPLTPTPPPPPCKSPPLQKKQCPPPPPPSTHMKTPFPPSLSSYTLTYKQILVKGNYKRPPPASSVPPSAKSGRGWQRFVKPNLTLHSLLIQFVVVVVLLFFIKPHYHRMYLHMRSH